MAFYNGCGKIAGSQNSWKSSKALWASSRPLLATWHKNLFAQRTDGREDNLGGQSSMRVSP